MKTIYCISGLGTDERIFEHLTIAAKLKFIPWLRPQRGEPLKKYAKRMADSIEHPRPILLGVSFGGMVAIEIAKQVPIERLIIVSSVKTTAELPPWMRLTGRLYLYKVLPTRSYKFTEKFDNRRLGVTNDDERKLVDSYRKRIDPVYFNWAVHRIFRWKNDWFPENIVQIHGERDRIFPLKRLTPTHVITGGTHIMILNKADKLSRCINSVI